jgi:hypothetical protein
VQRQVLHLGELSTSQLDSWQRTVDVIHEDGQRHQLRLFTDRDASAPNDPDVVEVRLSSLTVQPPRRFGDCWAGCQLWEQLGLRAFWQRALADETGAVPQAQRGYSRDHRPDCKQRVLALVVTPEGFPLTYEVFPVHRLDRTTLREMLDAIEQKHGKARRVWVFDRGIVSDENLALLRDYEAQLLTGTWQQVAPQVQVQLLPEDDEVLVLCRSSGRVAKERVYAAGVAVAPLTNRPDET